MDGNITRGFYKFGPNDWRTDTGWYWNNRSGRPRKGPRDWTITRYDGDKGANRERMLE